MNDTVHRQVNVTVDRGGPVRRREFLRTISAAGAAAGLLSWPEVMALNAQELRKRGMACILLWMQGGPSQFETFSPKPGHDNGGPTQAIPTSVEGIEIAENLPELAQVMEHLCLIRSMTSREGSHPRATYLMHTGYLPTASIKYPSLGAMVAHQIAPPASELPDFVRVGGGRDSSGGGLLGTKYDPFVVPRAGRPPNNAALTTSRSRFERRLDLLGRLESDYENSGGRQEVENHRNLYDTTSKMVLSPKMSAFDLDRESAAVREAYGSSPFGTGCLLARRLVEAGVTFIEVTAGGWDTHKDNFNRTKTDCEQIDQPFAQLIGDLAERGMLDSTLVMWMGEFGRTPRINGNTGRDHYPRAFNVALAGGGVKGGQVIGKTDAGGTSVTDRPVGVTDLLRTALTALKIDPDHENMSPIGRPIKLVDGGKVVQEVFA